jgi:mannose-6-phosphate isomerase-like protein (cupin superfamily)
MTRSLDLSRTFVHLTNRGDAEAVELTPSFWRESSSSALYDRVVGAFRFGSSEDLHSSIQEMHPEADEMLFVASGAIEVALQEGGCERTVSLAAGQAAIVPRGVWHRLIMREPGMLLFINCRTGMQSRDA